MRERARRGERAARRIARWTGWVAAFVASSSSTTRAAESPGRPLGEALTIVGGACLEGQALVARTTELLAVDRVEPRISAVVEEDPEGVRIVVRREETSLGTRTLELAGRACAEVREATALALAASLDGRLAAGTFEAAPPPATPAPMPAQAPGAGRPGTRPPPGPPQSPRPTVTVSAEVGVGAGLLPEPFVALAPAVELSLGHAVELRGSALVTAVQRVDLVGGGAGSPTASAEVGLAAGRLDGCLGGAVTVALRLRGCGGLLVGVVHAEGKGVPDPRSGSALWLAASLRGDARHELAGGLGVGLALESFVVPARAELAASAAATAPSRALSPVGGALLVGPFYRF